MSNLNSGGVEQNQSNMSSHRQILYHIIFPTKYRKPTINKNHKDELYKYIWGIIKNKNGMLYEINGMADHIHILCDLHPSIALADLVKTIKVATSKWMKENGKFPHFEGWAEGYGAFTYAYRDRQKISNYIRNQEKHHRQAGFLKEYIRFLDAFGIDYDERYL